jgi:hypothetical protein
MNVSLDGRNGTGLCVFRGAFFAATTYRSGAAKALRGGASGEFGSMWPRRENRRFLNQIIRAARALHTDKAQLRVGKYRSFSRQVAIDQSGKII